VAVSIKSRIVISLYAIVVPAIDITSYYLVIVQEKTAFAETSEEVMLVVLPVLVHESSF
jgi:hypothetical protein